MTLRHLRAPALGRFLLLSIGFGLLIQGTARADEESVSLPPVFTKTLPEGPGDLRAIQAHVKTLLKKTMPATVGLIIGGAQGSGVIVTKDGKVLTAGHVSGLADRKVQIIMPDGRKLTGKTLSNNPTIDSGMVQITEKADYPFCEMGHSADLKEGDWCIGIGHPGGWQKGRDPVLRLGRVQELKLKIPQAFIGTDCVLVGGDSGGPLFDMHGRVIGIHSRIGQNIAQNMHVPVDTYREQWDRLVLGQGYMGITPDENAVECRIGYITDGSPAAKAGLRVGDVIRKLNYKRIGTQDDLYRAMDTKAPGMEIKLEVQRGEENFEFNLNLVKRPN